MLDYNLVRNKEQTINQLVDGLTENDLASETEEMINTVLQMIADCSDEDVVFEPKDPQADDPFSDNENEVKMPWTLGHVIVHISASCEESAALAAELAHGVVYHGRSRSEVPWTSVKTAHQCRHRMEESRRMCLASLEMWPGEPYLENTYIPWDGMPPINAIGRYVLGLMHADNHLEQIKDILSQAQGV